MCEFGLSDLAHIGLLVPWKEPGFQRRVHEIVDAFRMSRDGIKPYCLRRGGATHFLEETYDFYRAQALGRWQDARACLIYVQEALAATAATRESPWQEQTFAH